MIFRNKNDRNLRFKKLRRMMGVVSLGLCLLLPPVRVHADEVEERIAAQQALPIESNQIADWPKGPVVTAKCAILMELETGTILYAKNIHSKEYPASTTKILTTLIAAERCELNETVTFSHDAVYGIPRGSNHIAMNEGDTLTMEQCLQAILIRSANEVSYAVAEHIGGTWEGFAQIMNDRAKELGCVDSNFVNPNGLPDENHVTSVYDLAMIGRAFFSNDWLCQTTLTPSLHIMKADGEFVDQNKMALLPGKAHAYEYIVGCKTGYTDVARSTLVSCAEKNGMKLICAVMKDENPAHYEDTIALFQYGFNNFQKVNIATSETKYSLDQADFFNSKTTIFGTSSPVLSLNKEDCVILPKTATFEETVSNVSYDIPADEVGKVAALIKYTYHDVPVGSVSVDIIKSAEKIVTTTESTETTDKIVDTAIDTTADQNTALAPILSPSPTPEPEKKEPASHFIFINIGKILLGIIGLVALFFLVMIIIHLYRCSKVGRKRKAGHYGSVLKPEISTRSIRKKNIREAKRRMRRRRRQ